MFINPAVVIVLNLFLNGLTCKAKIAFNKKMDRKKAFKNLGLDQKWNCVTYNIPGLIIQVHLVNLLPNWPDELEVVIQVHLVNLVTRDRC